jgi:hypothetical protein
MASFDTIKELFGLVTQDMKWGAAPPTRSSIKKIDDSLGVRIPDAYVQVATACPNYGAYLNGIGEDYDHEVHMLRLTHWFRSGPVPPLPEYYVLISHGHDGDCDCWDTREKTASGEHPIVGVSLQEAYGDTPPTVQTTDIRYSSFTDYLLSIVVYYGRDLTYSGYPPDIRARAAKLMEMLSKK